MKLISVITSATSLGLLAITLQGGWSSAQPINNMVYGECSFAVQMKAYVLDKCQNNSNSKVNDIHLEFSYDNNKDPAFPQVSKNYGQTCNPASFDCFGPEVVPGGFWEGRNGSPGDTLNISIWPRQIPDENLITYTGYWTLDKKPIRPEPLPSCTSTSTNTLDALLQQKGCSFNDKNFVFDPANYNGTLSPDLIRVLFTSVNSELLSITFESSRPSQPWVGGIEFIVELNQTAPENFKIAQQITSISADSDASIGWRTTASSANLGSCSGNQTIQSCDGLTFTPSTQFTSITNTLYSNAGLMQVTNTIRQTPGPFPVLGVFSAFRISRKLRTRIQDAK